MADTFPLVYVVAEGGDRWIVPVVSGHRYWQIDIKSCGAAFFGALTKVEMATTVGGSNLCVDGASCFASSSQTLHTADIALTNDSYFGGGGALPVQWWYDFGTAVDIAEVRISALSGFERYYPTSWDLKSSNDAITWTTENSFNVGSWVGGVQKTFANIVIPPPPAGHHEYWRVNITACVAGVYGALNEIAMATEVGGTNRLTGPGTIVSSGNNGSVESNAIDGDTTTYWGGSGAIPAYWGYHFSGPVDIVEVRITANDGLLNYHPSAFNLDYSDDGSTWTTQQSFTPATWVGGVTQVFDLS